MSASVRLRFCLTMYLSFLFPTSKIRLVAHQVSCSNSSPLRWLWALPPSWPPHVLLSRPVSVELHHCVVGVTFLGRKWILWSVLPRYGPRAGRIRCAFIFDVIWS